MVLYFSGTGNSRHAARKIAEISGDEIISINQRIKEGNYSPVTSQKPLVFVGPVYAGRLPRVMEGYIKKVAFSGKERVCPFGAGSVPIVWLVSQGAPMRRLSMVKRR